jgi:hypothetical protein
MRGPRRIGASALTSAAFYRGARIAGEPAPAASDSPELTGILHHNANRVSGTDCDMVGNICIEGIEYLLRGYWQPSSTGGEYLKLRALARPRRR